MTAFYSQTFLVLAISMNLIAYPNKYEKSLLYRFLANFVGILYSIAYLYTMLNVSDIPILKIILMILAISLYIIAVICQLNARDV